MTKESRLLIEKQEANKLRIEEIEKKYKFIEKDIEFLEKEIKEHEKELRNLEYVKDNLEDEMYERSGVIEAIEQEEKELEYLQEIKF